MSFRISGLAAEPFAHWFDLDDDELRRRHARRVVANNKPGFPCRISLTDAEPGQDVLLINYEHLPADSPYRARHAIYIRSGETRYDAIDGVPLMLRSRQLSVRAYNARQLMTAAEVVDGRELEAAIERLFADPAAQFLHVHFAAPGCYAALVTRA